MVDLSWISALIIAFQQHHPWLTDKVGAAMAAQPVRELWELIKAKLGPATVEKIESSADDPAQWELFKARLMVALDEDPVFQEKIRGLAGRTRQEPATITQKVSGNDIQQVAVGNSKKVNISVK